MRVRERTLDLELLNDMIYTDRAPNERSKNYKDKELNINPFCYSYFVLTLELPILFPI